MSEDRHADERDRKRHRRRYGHATTNPGMRILMRELAQRHKDAQGGAEVMPAQSSGKRRVRIRRRRRKHS